MKQLQYKDRRMRLLTEMLDGMKLVKLYAWESAFERLVELIRVKELKFLKFSSALYGVIKMSYGCTNLLVSTIFPMSRAFLQIFNFLVLYRHIRSILRY